MSETLVDFLIDLASTPNRLKAFLANPTSIVEHSRLSESDKAAVLSRDSRKVLKALGVAAGKTVMQMYSRGPRTAAGKVASTPKTKKTASLKK